MPYSAPVKWPLLRPRAVESGTVEAGKDRGRADEQLVVEQAAAAAKANRPGLAGRRCPSRRRAEVVDDVPVLARFTGGGTARRT